jgi:hypothetical protein
MTTLKVCTVPTWPAATPSRPPTAGRVATPVI